MVGGNYVIGVVIFLVLIAIQYVVINHGAVRISEVTARFTLDALPGKQMSIDSDLNAGLIDEAEARAPAQAARRRGRVLRRHGRRIALHAARRGGEHSDHGHQHHRGLPDRRAAARHGSAARARDLHGADHRRRPGDGHPGADDLDFGRPDRHARQFRRAAGRGLPPAGLRQRPAAAAGRRRAGRHGGVLRACRRFRSCCSGGGIGDVGLADAPKSCQLPKDAGRRRPRRAPRRRTSRALLKVEPLAVEVGLGLVRLVEGGQNSPLLRRIAASAASWPPISGICCRRSGSPTISRCARASMSILLKGVEIARYELPQGCELAIPSGEPATPSRGPAHTRAGLRHAGAVDSGPSRSEAARAAPATPWWTRLSVLGTHLAEMIRRHAARTVLAPGRQEAAGPRGRGESEGGRGPGAEIAAARDRAAGAAEPAARTRFDPRRASRFWKRSARPPHITRNPVLLTEYVRQAIRRMVVKPYLNASGDLPAYFLDPALEQAIERGRARRADTAI